MSEENPPGSSDKTRVRTDASPAEESIAEADSSSSMATNIRSTIALSPEDDITEQDDTGGDKTVVIGAGLSSSNDATIVVASGQAPASGAPTLTLGNTKVINDRFELLDVLGSGGMGVVFKALDRRKVEAQDRDPYVAIKLLNDDFKAHPHSVISLQREARRSQKLAHPNIVNVHDFDRDGDQVFMTMECLKGKPLDELIKDNGRKPLPLEVAHRILKDMCQAMIHAHNNNIAHSDFKPGNIFVTDAGEAKVLDFGIARAVTSGINTDGGHENTLFDPSSLGALTPAYASREMLTGQLPEIGDDVYAVGCVAYELFTGQHPFKKKNAVDAKKAGMRPARIRSLSARQWKALRKALAFKRQDRYGSAAEFWEDFDRRFSPVWLVASLVVLIAGGAAIWSVEQNSRLEGVDENAIRLQADQENAYGNLQAWIERQPLSAVEQDLRSAFEKYQQLVPEGDEKVENSRQQVVALYLEEAEQLRQQQGFTDAEARLETALSWDAALQQSEKYQLLLAAIASDSKALRLKQLAQKRALEDQQRMAEEQAAAVERQRLAEENRVRAAAEARARETQYQTGLAQVEATLACKSVPDFGSLKQQLNSLRSLDGKRYQQKQSQFAERLAICVKRIANSNPIAGKAAQSSALALFPASSILQSIVIDPCASSRLGSGSGRRDGKFCFDRLAGTTGGPKMVIVSGVDGSASFAIGKYEVSAKELGVYCRASNSCVGINDTTSDLPARGLTSDQADAYAKWLSKETGFDYRLPSYQQWHHAAKASGRKKNLDPNCTVKRVNGTRAGDELRVAGGGYNDWGLYNVVGNVREWALDGSSLVVAGGRHTDRLADVACSLQSRQAHSGEADDTTGFRLVRSIKR